MTKFDHSTPHDKRYDCTKRCAAMHARWSGSNFAVEMKLANRFARLCGEPQTDMNGSELT